MAGLFILFSFVISGGFLAWIVFRYVIFTHFPLIHSGLKLDVKFLLTRTALVLGVILGLCFLYWVSRDTLARNSEYLDAFIIAFLMMFVVINWFRVGEYLSEYNKVVLRPNRQAKQRSEYNSSLGTKLHHYDQQKSVIKYVFILLLPVIFYSFVKWDILTSRPIQNDIEYLVLLYYCIVSYFLYNFLRISAKLYLRENEMEITSYFGKTQFIPYEEIVEVYPNKNNHMGEIILLLSNFKRIRFDMNARQLGAILEELLPRLVNLRRLDIEDYLPEALWQKIPDRDLIEKVKQRVEKNKALWEKNRKL